MRKSAPGIYKALGLDGFELCHPVSKDDFVTIDAAIDGTPRRLGWRPISMQLVHEDEGKELVTSDSPWLGNNALIFRTSAVQALGGILGEYGELLPLKCPEAELWVYNPTRVLDALDEEASSITRFSSGKIMMIRRHVFREAVVAKNDIFKIPNLRSSSTYLSHRFVDLWKSSGLRGLEFNLVWAAPN